MQFDDVIHLDTPENLQFTSSAPSLTTFRGEFLIAFIDTEQFTYYPPGPDSSGPDFPGTNVPVYPPPLLPPETPPTSGPRTGPPDSTPGPGTPRPPWHDPITGAFVDTRYKPRINVARSPNGYNWQSRVRLGNKSNSTPDIASIPGNPPSVVLNWRDRRTQEVRVRFSHDATGWVDEQQVAHDTTSTGPAILATDERLVTAFRGRTNPSLYVASAPLTPGGLEWTHRERLAELTNAKPDLVRHSGRVYLGWPRYDFRNLKMGPNHGQLCLLGSRDGVDWDRLIVTDVRCQHMPSLASFDSRLFCAWLDMWDGRLYTGEISV